MSGADTVSLLFAASSEAEPLLLHDGASPVPELATLQNAATFARDGHRNQGRRFVEATDSAAPNGKLVVVPCSPSAPGEAPNAPPGGKGRRSRDAIDARESPMTCWIGLQFETGERATAAVERLLASTACRRASGGTTGSLLELAGVLVWYARHISVVLDDPLTGLAGRTEFQAYLAHTLEQAMASRSPVALLLVNPDDFTSVNETEGHEAGDRILREIGARLRKIHRATDAIAKYGGAIFASLLDGAEATAARVVAEKVWDSLTERSFLDGAVRLGVSVGLSVYEPDDPTLDSHLELIRRADKALSAARRFGGNRVVEWEPDLESRDLGAADRMTGVYTGNMAKDYRNMTLLSDTMSAIAGAARIEDLVTRVTERLHRTLKTERIAIFQELDGELQLMKGLTRPVEDNDSSKPRDGVALTREQRALIEEARRDKRVGMTTFPTEGRDGKVLAFAIPLVLNQRAIGCLYLDGREQTLTLDGSTDLGFLSAFAIQLAVALDRARLSELSKRRSESEQLRLRTEVEDLRSSLQRNKLVYRSPEMESLLETIRRVAPTRANVLVIGESGTGKELVARTIHELSPFKNKPLVVVDCSAIPTTLIESELFGHERGAYTGADEKRVGRLLEAEGGTVVLDEIGEVPLAVQSKLLRFVQERQVVPVGGTRVRHVDTRLVAVTNRELAVEAAAGRFREDLYYRLNVLRLTVPPLRERREDVLHLAQYFLERFSEQYHKASLTYSPRALDLMHAYGWPGNVRELQHRILQAVILSEGPEIEAGDLELEQLPPEQTVEMDLTSIRRPTSNRPSASPGNGRPRKATPQEIWCAVRDGLRRQIDAAVSELGATPAPIGAWLEEDLVIEAFEAAGRVPARAHALLGVPESTFRRRLRKATSKSRGEERLRHSPWEQMAPLLSELVRAAPGSDEDVLQTARAVLLNEVLASAVGASTAAALMGVTVRTYRRWTSEAPARASSIGSPVYE